VELANPNIPLLPLQKFMKARAKKIAHIRRSLILVKYLWETQPSSVSEISHHPWVNWQ